MYGVVTRNADEVEMDPFDCGCYEAKGLRGGAAALWPKHDPMSTAAGTRADALHVTAMTT